MVATCCPNNAPVRLSAKGASNSATGSKAPPAVLLVVLLPVTLDDDRGTWPLSGIPLFPAKVVAPLGVSEPTVGADPLGKRDRERAPCALGLADIVRAVGGPVNDTDGKADVGNAAYLPNNCKDEDRDVDFVRITVALKVLADVVELV